MTPTGERPIRVLVIDDSAMIRSVIKRVLTQAGDIDVVATAPNAIEGRDRLVELRPDVVTLDIEMPGLNGISFLEAMSKHLPTPTIIFSALAPERSALALAALEAGAFDVLVKPANGRELNEVGAHLVARVRAAARASGARRHSVAAVPAPAPSGSFAPAHVIGLVASTGGTRALQTILPALPGNMPPIVVVQHLVPLFLSRLAQRLDAACELDVREATDGELFGAGCVCIAPGDRHLSISAAGDQFRTQVHDGPRVHEQRPSGDILLQSMAHAAGPRGVGVVLTGMGQDGAAGLLAMRHAGAQTFAQDEHTSVVFGMPREALAIGAAERAVALPQVAATLVTSVSRGRG